MEVIKKHSWIILLCVISLLAHWVWFTFGIFTHNDWWYFTPETTSQFASFAYNSTWRGEIDLGTGVVEIYYFLFYFIRGVSTLFAGADAVGQFLVYQLPIMLVAPIGSFLLLYKILRHKFAAFIGSLFFVSTTYFLNLQSEHLTIALAYAFCPITLLAFVHLLGNIQKQGFRWATIMVFTMALAFQLLLEPRVLYILLPFFLPALLFIRKGWRSYLLVGGGVLALSLYWILPLWQIGSSGIDKLISRPLFGNQFQSLAHALTTMRGPWTWSEPIVFALEPITAVFWMLPLVVFSGLLFLSKVESKRFRSLTLFVYAIALIGIFLVKQSHAPLPGVYGWMYENIPGFGLFRESSKFNILVTLSYSYLIPVSLIILLERGIFELRPFWRILRLAFLTGVLSIAFFCLAPLASTTFGSMFVSRTVPSDYLAINRNLLAQNTYFRTVEVPSSSRWAMFSILHPRASQLSLKSAIHTIDNSIPGGVHKEDLIAPFKKTYSNSLYDLLSVRYIYLDFPDTNNDVDPFLAYGSETHSNPRKWYEHQLNEISWLERIDMGTEELVVYENEGYKEHVSSFTSLHSFDSLANLDKKYSLVTDKLWSEFYFVSPGEGKSPKPLANISSPFENLQPENISTHTLIGAFKTEQSKKTSLYLNHATDGDIFVNSSSVLATTSATLLSLSAPTNTIAYKDSLHSYENILSNGSFETGAWQENVGDCNNYDDNGLLAMNLNTVEKTDGNQSLQLEATRHIACTSIRLDVASSSTYLLSFDYQSPNAEQASYYVGFNDPTKKHISEALPLADTNWHTFSKTIEIPEGTTALSLFLYARATDGETNIINRYDNVSLIAIPDLRDAFYIVSEPQEKLVEPAAVAFDLVNPTKKLVHIEGATTPFFLAMSESYHDQWQLQMNNSKVHGFLNGWWPFAKPDRVGDEYHYKLNGFLNGWYVSTEELCAGARDEVLGTSEMQGACTQNPDGSYDIEMVIEFWPQRWFYLGLLISGTTLLGCLGYLGYDGIRRIRRKKMYV